VKRKEINIRDFLGVSYIPIYENESLPIPQLKCQRERLDNLKHWCYVLGTEDFDIKLAIKSLNRNTKAFKYRCSSIWTTWLFCNYLPKKELDNEFIWIHYLFNNFNKLEDPCEAWVWLETMFVSNRIISPLPKDFNKLFDIGILIRKDNSLHGSKIDWGISDIPDFLESLRRKKVAMYISEAISSTWERNDIPQ